MKKEHGQGLIEYLILVCLIGLSAITVVSVVSKNIKEQYANVSNALNNRDKVEHTTPDPSSYDFHGMDNFMEGAKVHKR